MGRQARGLPGGSSWRSAGSPGEYEAWLAQNRYAQPDRVSQRVIVC